MSEAPVSSTLATASHFPIPRAPIEAYQRNFLIDARGKVEVTSVDISNHGMFLVVGCSNGAVLLYNLTKRVQSGEGIYLGQINCKGIHSVMSMKVKISDDCRFCFAGVIRGSNELIAIDLSHLQWSWSDFGASATAGKGKKGFVTIAPPSPPDLFETFILADAKLKGFGACCSKFTETTLSESGVKGHQYLLASGLGIKNVHVWELTVYDEPVSLESGTIAKKDHWKCIYDVATNGNTITHLGFRNFGRELISKSGTFNIRVWDISKYKEEPNSKPAYEDIANSQDVKCLLETSDFAYGGIYDFSMVKVDKNIPKEANRNIFELPDKALPESQYEESVRRRRTMREVIDVVGTQDGEHVLVKVADGGVLHFHHPKTTHSRSNSPTGIHNDENVDQNAATVDKAADNSVGGSIVGHLQELPSPAKDGDLEQAWTLKRVGNEGLVVVARAFFHPDAKEKEKENSNNVSTPGIITGLGNAIAPQQKGMTLVSIFPLSQLNGDLSATSFMATEHSIKRWHPTGSFYRSPKPLDTDPSVPLSSEKSGVEMKSSVVDAETSGAANLATVDSGAETAAAVSGSSVAAAVPSSVMDSPRVKVSTLLPAMLYPMDAEALQAAAMVSTPSSGKKNVQQSPAGIASAGVFASAGGVDTAPAAIRKRKSATNMNDSVFQSPSASGSMQRPPLPPASAASASAGVSRQTSSQSAASSSSSSARRNSVQAMFEDAAIAAGMAPEHDAEHASDQQYSLDASGHNQRAAGRPRGSANRHRQPVPLHQHHLVQQQLQQLQQNQFGASASYSEDMDADMYHTSSSSVVEPYAGPYPALCISPYTAASLPGTSSKVLPLVPITGYTEMLEKQRLTRMMEQIVQTWSETFQSDRYPEENILFTGSVKELTAQLHEVGQKRSLDTETITVNTENVSSRPVNNSHITRKVLSIAIDKDVGDATLASPVVEDQWLVTAMLLKSLGIYANQQFGRILFEQEKMKSLLVQEVKRLLLVTFKDQVLTAVSAGHCDTVQRDLAAAIEGLVRRYHRDMCEELQRQQQEFLAARQRDSISQVDPVASAQTMGISLTPKSTQAMSPLCREAQIQVHFRYVDILQRTMQLPSTLLKALQ